MEGRETYHFFHTPMQRSISNKLVPVRMAVKTTIANVSEKIKKGTRMSSAMTAVIILVFKSVNHFPYIFVRIRCQTPPKRLFL